MTLDHTSPGHKDYQTWVDNVARARSVMGTFVRVDWPRLKVSGHLCVCKLENDRREIFAVRMSDHQMAWFLPAAIETVRFPELVSELNFSVIITIRK